MQLTVPFLPDDLYTAFLSRNADRIHSVYFSLYHDAAADARHRFHHLPAHVLADALSCLPGIRKYALLNARFQHPNHYLDPETPLRVMERLRILADQAGLDGVVFADPSFLLSLSDADPVTAVRLEAVPSVNLMADDIHKIRVILDLVARTRFRPPARLPLERSLNRRPRHLAALARDCRTTIPGIRLEVLVNEGCLWHCPFKLTHDALIALSHAGGSADTFAINRKAGCFRVMGEEPWRLLASPFIRPEDVGAYAGMADILKISGRTLGPDFLRRTITAYLDGGFEGSLPALLDAANWMDDIFDIPNQRLPKDFRERLAACDGNCAACGWCIGLFERITVRRPFHLNDLRGSSCP